MSHEHLYYCTDTWVESVQKKSGQEAHVKKEREHYHVFMVPYSNSVKRWKPLAQSQILHCQYRWKTDEKLIAVAASILWSCINKCSFTVIVSCWPWGLTCWLSQHVSAEAQLEPFITLYRPFSPLTSFPSALCCLLSKKALFVPCVEQFAGLSVSERDWNAKPWCPNSSASIHQSEPTETSLLSCYFFVIKLPVQNFGLPPLTVRLTTQKLTMFLWLHRLQRFHAKASMTHSKTYSFSSSALENWSLWEDMTSGDLVWPKSAPLV